MKIHTNRRNRLLSIEFGNRVKTWRVSFGDRFGDAMSDECPYRIRQRSAPSGEVGDDGVEQVCAGGAGGSELHFQLVDDGHQLIHFGHDPALFGEWWQGKDKIRKLGSMIGWCHPFSFGRDSVYFNTNGADVMSYGVSTARSDAT
jgi:hypothetical protein